MLCGELIIDAIRTDHNGDPLNKSGVWAADGVVMEHPLLPITRGGGGWVMVYTMCLFIFYVVRVYVLSVARGVLIVRE